MHFGVRAAAAVAAVLIIAAVGINLAGSSPTRVGGTPLPSGAAGNPTATPGLASHSEPEAVSDARGVARLDGDGPRRIRVLPVQRTRPAAAPDARLDGLPMAFLPSDKGRQRMPVWSPDGTRWHSPVRTRTPPMAVTSSGRQTPPPRRPDSSRRHVRRLPVSRKAAPHSQRTGHGWRSSAPRARTCRTRPRRSSRSGTSSRGLSRNSRRLAAVRRGLRDPPSLVTGWVAARVSLRDLVD